MTKTNDNRNSGLELYRIILMFIIIMHHFVVNSGLKFDMDYITGNMMFARIAGCGGRWAISGFTLITGYFMCKVPWTWKRFLKLYLEIKFYEIILFIIFLSTGQVAFSWDSVVRYVFNVANEAGYRYIGTIVWLYLLIPFLNILIRGMTRKQHKYLLILLFCYFTVVSTVLLSKDTFVMFWWMVTVYLCGAYIRCWPEKLFRTDRIWLWVCGTIVSAVLIVLSIILIIYSDSKYVTWNWYLVTDANKILAVAIAGCSFMMFKNMKLPYLPWVNWISASVFGVLMIHAGSDEMRQVLWVKWFKVAERYPVDGWLYMLAVCAAVFIVAVLLDHLRAFLVEKPFFRWYDKLVD